MTAAAGPPTMTIFSASPASGDTVPTAIIDGRREPGYAAVNFSVLDRGWLSEPWCRGPVRPVRRDAGRTVVVALSCGSLPMGPRRALGGGGKASTP